MRVLVTGASGLVGSALVHLLQASGDEVVRFVRSSSIDLAALEGFDAVVHLAGESIASGRWTAERKKRILESRTRGTSLLVESLAKLKHPPKVLVSASAIGFYGDRGSEWLSEESLPGIGFLADVCRRWENAALAAENCGIRVVCVRIGVVLSTRGGALGKMLFPFRMGVGGRIGSGVQYMSWISLNDLCRAIQHAIFNDRLQGNFNGVAPSPVTNAEFTRALGTALGRPTIFPLPAFVAHLLLGEMADELLLSSSRVSSAKLQKSGFIFHDTEIGDTLKRILKEAL